MSARGLFVTGTDTGVGKTLVACALTRALTALGLKVAVLKPVASGALRTPQGLRNEDALSLAACANVGQTYEEVNRYCFEPPISPHIAADEARISIDTGLIAGDFRAMAARADWVVAEGAGGWLAPLGAEQTMADLAAALPAQVLLVVGLRLGCLNHAALTRAAIRERGVACAGWIASAMDPHLARAEENLASLTRSLGEPPLEVVPYQGAQAPPLLLAQAAAQLTQRELKHLRRLE
jgi:dethiobiotin synthetase